MFLTVDANDPRPIYRQVADGIKALIAGGGLRAGMMLPSVRQVAADLGVNLNTVAIAYRELQDEGLVAIRHGAGAVVAPRHAKGGDNADLRTALRTALTEYLLAGLSDREIVAVVRQELDSLRKKGSPK